MALFGGSVSRPHQDDEEPVRAEPLRGEAHIVINGVVLNSGQSLAVRCAIAEFCMNMNENRDSCGTDQHGRNMHAAYWKNASEVQSIIVRR